MDWFKNKKVIIILSCILIVIGIGGYILLSDTSVLKIKQETVIYEYGDIIELTTKDLLKNTDEKVLANVQIESNLENEPDKEYPKLGKYEATVSYEKEKVMINLEIKDTKAPTFNNCNSVEFIKGTDFDYSKYIVATDLQEVTYEWKKETVDINTVGEYTMTVVVSDASNNKATKDIKVYILDTVDMTTNEVTTSIDESGNVKTIVTEKPKVEVPSSNSTNKDTQTSTPNTNNTTKPKAPTKTPEATQKPEESHQHYSTFISPLFDTNEERQQWAEDYLYSPENTQYSGYGTATCSCGKKGVTYFY